MTLTTKHQQQQQKPSNLFIEHMGHDQFFCLMPSNFVYLKSHIYFANEIDEPRFRATHEISRLNSNGKRVAKIATKPKPISFQTKSVNKKKRVNEKIAHKLSVQNINVVGLHGIFADWRTQVKHTNFLVYTKFFLTLDKMQWLFFSSYICTVSDCSCRWFCLLCHEKKTWLA